MRRLFVLLLMMTLLVMLAWPCLADETMTVTVTFDAAELSWESRDGYDMPRLSDCDLIREVGAPQLPAQSVQVAIPVGLEVDHVEVIEASSHLLPQQRRIYPAQPPQILSVSGGKSQAISFVQPHPAIYRGESPYPGRVVEHTGCGHMGPVQLANLVVYPLQYLPEEEKVLFHDRVDVVLHLSPTYQVPCSRRSPDIGRQDTRIRVIERLAHNDEYIGRLYPDLMADRDAVLDEDLAEYVIITDLAFQGAFQELADWKTKKGVPARVMTLQEIDSQYGGADRRERVRNFIAQAYESWGTLYVLLAGDTQLIPHRYAYAMDSETEYNDIPCDLYYADLDGDWNADGDAIYGEVDDDVDLYPEVFLGRAPVSTVAQAQNFVRKVLTYEKPALLDYQEKALFAAEVLWYDPFTDASKSKDLIDERYLPDRFDPVTKLYETLGNEDTYSVMNALNGGQNIFNHDGHAYFSVMGMGSGYLDNSQVDYLHNGDRIGLVYSIGCWPAAFDYDCIAEHFVNNPQGGAVAFIGNSRYGWGSPGNPCFGYSDRFDQHFFKTVFEDGITRLGAALATSKAHYAPRSRQENVYRWHQYQLTLLGDPEMSLWTRTPGTMMVDHPQQMPADSGRVSISVVSEGGPVEGALVCLMGEAGLYRRSATDRYGQAHFSVFPASTETLWVTVTAAEFLPYEGHIMVVSSGPHLAVEMVDLEEMAGNGDGAVSPQEQIGLGVSIKNWGNQTAAGVTATITWEDEYLARGDSAVYLGDIAPGEVVSTEWLCCFTVDEQCPNDHILCFQLHLQDGQGHSWKEGVGVLVVTPLVSYQSSWLEDHVRGNGNGIPEAGEELDLHMTLSNEGGEQARGLVVQLSAEDPYVHIVQSSADLGDLDPDAEAEMIFQIQVDAHCPEPQFSVLEMMAGTSDGYQFEQRLLLTIGRVGFFDDLESGSIYWSHYSTSSQWHFTDRRTHSGSKAWYCGGQETETYSPNMDCALTAFPMVIGPGAELSFWHWYDLATYGSDGLYVEINDGSGWEVLDFLGSGGALDSTLIGNDWFEDSYDLSHVPPGTFLQVRFRFFSDGDTSVAEGVYVDDVRLSCDVISGSGQDPVPCRPLTFSLSQNYPNPFNGSTQLVLEIPVHNPQHWGHLPVATAARIFNISGQQVKTLIDAPLGAGKHVLIWDGTDGDGRTVGSGIYFCRVEAGSYRRDVKMVLLR